MNWTEDWFLAWALVWLIVVLGVPRSVQGLGGLLVSFLFLAWIDWFSLAYLLCLTLFSYVMLRGEADRHWLRLAVVPLVMASFLIMKLGVQIGNDSVIIVVGLAFASLSLIHVALEVAFKRVVCTDLLSFLSYVLFFPTLIAGPVHLINDFQRDERRRRFDSENMAIGFERVLYGLVQIVIFAGWLGQKLEKVDIGHEEYPALSGWYACFQYGWNLYFNFAGYSSVAIGLALVAGYRVPENFSYPFLATNIADFWRSWHASLSAWCRAYVAEPIMAMTRSRWLAIVASMLVLGIWHEISLRYCVWGLYHGLGIAVYQTWNRYWKDKAPDFGVTKYLRAGVGWMLTQAFVIVSFAITSSTDLEVAWSLMKQMFGFA